MKDRVPGAPGQYKAVVTEAELQKMHAGEQFAITMTRDDQPIVEGTPYSKAAVLPDSLAALLCPSIADPTPADALAALLPKSGGAMTGALDMGGKEILNAAALNSHLINGAQIEGFKSGSSGEYHALWKYGNSVYLFLGYCNGVGACAYVASSKEGEDAVDVHKIAGNEYSSIQIYCNANEVKFGLLPYSNCLVIRIGTWYSQDLG